ncbi:T9SS-dependent M36 family metallopeptidase [Kaistella sp.]|uniref:T9SS-dependent M36 family metallopeptidase n=1 Tax=Kaistella sp. TaxID=2782235 RepID=UPI003C3F7844
MKKKLLFTPLSVAVFFAFNQLNGQNSEKVIRDYYQQNNALLKTDHKAGVIILNEDASKSMNANIVNVQQTYNGLRVYNALGKVILKNGKIISEKNDFKNKISIPSAEGPISDVRVSEEILKSKLNLKDLSRIEYLPNVYFEKNNSYILCNEVFISDKNSSDVWHLIVNATTGEILLKGNLTIDCNFENFPSSEQHNKPVSKNYLTQIQSINNIILSPTPASYKIFPLPTEAPTFGAISVINNPWDLIASPEGWHSDGTNNYTNTRGNNVYAYSDEANTNTPGYSPDGGASLKFNFPYTEGRNFSPFNYRDTAITNLFYMNNKIHDVFYKFGFTESARNYQTNNFGNGGMGNDAVLAEAFDGSGLNNANFNPGYETIFEGTTYLLAPRMQMYVWDRAQSNDDPIGRYQFNSPAGVASRPKVMTGSAAFGKLLFEGESVTGDLKISAPEDACSQPAAGSLTGKISLIARGTCEFGLKVLNAQKAGAIGAIIYSPNDDATLSMGGGTYGGQVTIPTINMGRQEGSFLVTELTGGETINTTLVNDFNGFKHSSLDNGIVIHEYGHGISNRLTGQGYSCLLESVSIEQMGEGWSDYFALMLTARPGDNSALARGMGTYSFDQPTNGIGLRLAKYSPDFAINNYTYGKTNTVTGPHAFGFIWATMLWDLTWKYVEKYGYNNDVLANPNSGNAKVLQLVMDGLKLQECNPSFIDGRNAILQADQITTGGENKCMIWGAFAKRGLGVTASAGNKEIGTDQVENFSYPPECNATLATINVNSLGNKYVVFPNPTYDEFFVGNIDKSNQDVLIHLYDLSGKLLITESRKSSSRKAISIKSLKSGMYLVKIVQGSESQTEKLFVK